PSGRSALDQSGWVKAALRGDAEPAAGGLPRLFGESEDLAYVLGAVVESDLATRESADGAAGAVGREDLVDVVQPGDGVEQGGLEGRGAGVADVEGEHRA